MVRDGLGYEPRPSRPPSTIGLRHRRRRGTAVGWPSPEASGVAVSGHRRRHFWRPPPPTAGREKLILYSFFIIFRKNRVLEVQFLKLDILCKTWFRDGLGYEPKPIRSAAGLSNSKNEYYTQFSPFFTRVVFMMSVFWNWTSFIKYVWEMGLVMN